MCPSHSHVGRLFTLWRRKRDASQLIDWSDREELSNPAMREEQGIKFNLQMGKRPTTSGKPAVFSAMPDLV